MSISDTSLTDVHIADNVQLGFLSLGNGFCPLSGPVVVDGTPGDLSTFVGQVVAWDGHTGNVKNDPPAGLYVLVRDYAVLISGVIVSPGSKHVLKLNKADVIARKQWVKIPGEGTWYITLESNKMTGYDGINRPDWQAGVLKAVTSAPLPEVNAILVAIVTVPPATSLITSDMINNDVKNFLNIPQHESSFPVFPSFTTGQKLVLSNTKVGMVVFDITLDKLSVCVDLTTVISNNMVEYDTSTPGSGPVAICSGPDGNLWFVESAANKIGKITTSGTVTEYNVPTASSGVVYGITSGPDGNVWFTEQNADKIGKITTSGVITEYNIPTSGSGVNGITSGPDGNLWFAEYNANKIGKITTSGTVTEYNVPTASSNPFQICSGPDGNLWFVEVSSNKIGKITTSGTVTEYNVPTPDSVPYNICSGPDGNLWFVEIGANKIGKITTSGTVTEYNIPTSGSGVYGIASGSDGNLWFTEAYVDKIGKVTTSGVFTEYPVTTASSFPFYIASGSDGKLWFTEGNAHKIAKVSTSVSAVTTPVWETITSELE